MVESRKLRGSSMVEQEAVNFKVTGSSPVRGAFGINGKVVGSSPTGGVFVNTFKSSLLLFSYLQL